MARGNQIRIIAGRHRGRRLPFPAVPGLRPTPDRLRETLFNWLQGEIGGRRCLDLFAGSGALGLEALSRGAAFVQFVERDPRAARQLQDNLETLRAGPAAALSRADALRWLKRSNAGPPFDLVFLDPPYARDLLPRVCALLEEGGWLAPGALIYLEQDSHRPWAPLPDGWSVHREAVAGQAAARLVRRARIEDPAPA